MLFISLILQLILKKSLKKIVNMYLVMQLMVYQLTLSVELPSLLQVMLEEFIKLIEFKSLNIVYLTRLFLPDFQLKQLWLGFRVQIVDEDQSKMLEEDFLVDILVLVLFLIVALFGFVVSRLLRNEKVRAKLQNLKETMIWNGLIMTLLITHFKHSIRTGEQVKLLFKESRFSSLLSLIISLAVLAIHLFLTVFTSIFLFKKRDRLNDPVMLERCGNLYFNQKILTNSDMGRVYKFPAFLTHRWVFAAVAAVLVMHPGIQLMFVV